VRDLRIGSAKSVVLHSLHPRVSRWNVSREICNTVSLFEPRDSEEAERIKTNTAPITNSDRAKINAALI
jgi:hypothetical protein